MAEITLRKYHGLGNDYLIYDPNRNACELQERQVEALCRRNLGVGAGEYRTGGEPDHAVARGNQ